MIAVSSTVVAAVQSADGLTWTKFVDNLPTDPAGIFVLLLLGGAVAWVLIAGRSGRGGGRSAPPTSGTPA